MQFIANSVPMIVTLDFALPFISFPLWGRIRARGIKKI
jgi:hypothetical protein